MEVETQEVVPEVVETEWQKKARRVHDMDWESILTKPFDTEELKSTIADHFEAFKKISLDLGSGQRIGSDSEVETLQKLLGLRIRAGKGQILLAYIDTILATIQGQVFKDAKTKMSDLYAKLDPDAIYWKDMRAFKRYVTNSKRWYQLTTIFGTDICFILDPVSNSTHFYKMGLLKKEDFEEMVIEWASKDITPRSTYNLNDLQKILIGDGILTPEIENTGTSSNS